MWRFGFRDELNRQGAIETVGSALIRSGRKRGEIMKLVFKDPQFAFQLLRTLGRASWGGSDIGECLSTASRIREGDFESWYAEWLKTAERIQKFADGRMEAGHRVSARESFLRAAGYYSVAEFYLHGDPEDPRIGVLSKRSRDCFLQAVQLSDLAVEAVEIPYEGTVLPGYFYPARSGAVPGPTLLLQTGFDGTIEELHGAAVAASMRGIHCLTFEGPGQGRVIREQGLPFRPDWEVVVSAVMDYVLARTDVDSNRVALMGLSFGGYLAPRAAAFEHRLAACIADGGVFNYLESMVPPAMTARELLDVIRDDPEGFDRGAREAAAADTTLKWGLDNGLFTFKASSPSDYFLKCSEYTLENVADRISCPTLVVESENEAFFRGQAMRLFEALKCPKDFMMFTEEEGAGEHCQVGAGIYAGARIFDWLAKTLGNSD